MLSAFLEDLHASLRALLRRPGSSATAGVILVIGLSASVAVFTYVNAFHQPFPGADAKGLVQVFGVEDDDPYVAISYLDFVDYDAAANRTLDGLTAVTSGYAASVRLEESTEVAFVETVAGDYFGVLGAEMSEGRALTVDDNRPGAEPVAVLSHEWWSTTFGADPATVGRVVQLNFRPHTVVGVAAPGFLGSTAGFRPHVWIPFEPFRNRYVSWDTQAQDRDRPLVRVYGRLRGGASRELVTAEVGTLASGLDERYPGVRGPRRLRVEKATWIDPTARLAEQPTTRLMTYAVAGLLLLVCANVANLLLALATGRTREMAVHAALGASPGRLRRRVLLENVLLAGGAGVVALLLAVPASTRLGSYFARPSVWGENVSRDAAIDYRVVLFALGLSVLTGLVAGALPAMRASRRELVATLKADGDRSLSGFSGSGGHPGGLRRGLGVGWVAGRWLPRGARRGRGPGAQDLLITVQVALSVVLLVTAGLVLRTLDAASAIDPGFAYDDMVASFVSTSSTNIEVPGRETFFEELAARMAEEPWIRAATISDNAILSGHGSADLLIEGQMDPVPTVFSKIHPNFFDVLGIDVTGGRAFVASDTAGGHDVALVNQALVRRFFPDGESVGRVVRWPAAAGSPARGFEIVGVVEDARTRDFLAPPEPTLYLPYKQHAYGSGSALLIATRSDPAVAVPLIYQWLREFEPHLAIVNVLPYSEVVSGFLYVQRMNAELFSALAVLGLILSALGVFSVMTLVVSRRTREIGIRMAMGARRRDIGSLVTSRALAPVAVGLAFGMLAAALLAKVLRSLLYGVEPWDPVAVLTSIVVLVAATLLAIYLPTRRAVSVEPVAALRWRG